MTLGRLAPGTQSLVGDALCSSLGWDWIPVDLPPGDDKTMTSTRAEKPSKPNDDICRRNDDKLGRLRLAPKRTEKLQRQNDDIDDKPGLCNLQDSGP